VKKEYKRGKGIKGENNWREGGAAKNKPGKGINE
jgi:hypothetical protein